MKGNILKLVDIRLRRFCRGLDMGQRRRMVWGMFIPFSAACLYTAVLPFVRTENGPSGNSPVFVGDSVRVEFIQSIVKDEGKSRKDVGTVGKAVQASGSGRGEAAE